MEYGVADILLLPAKLPPITEEEQAQGKWPADKSLLFTYPFFQKYAKEIVIDEYLPDWKERFFALLSHPIVSSLLFLGLVLGFYLELSTPGFGAAGTLAVTCLFLIILSSFANRSGQLAGTHFYCDRDGHYPRGTFRSAHLRAFGRYRHRPVLRGPFRAHASRGGIVSL